MTDYPADTVSALLARGADDAPAIGAPGRPWLTHGGLRALAERDRRRAERHRHRPRRPRGAGAAERTGGGRRRSSPIACGATTAPLNPAYKADEFAFYLADLNARALVVQAGRGNARRASRGRRAGHSGGGTGAEATAGRRFRPAAAAPADRHAGAARRGAGGGCRAGAAHLGHHVAAEDRAAAACQRDRVGLQHRRRRWR